MAECSNSEITRREFLKNSGKIAAAGLTASVLGSGMSYDNMETQRETKPSIPNRRLPSPKIDNLKSEGEPFKTNVIELPFTTKPGDRLISTEFPLDINPEDYDIIIAGGHMWSQSTTIKPPSLMDFLPVASNRVIGMREYEETQEDLPNTYHEPRLDPNRNSENKGRSYGFVALRHKTTGEDLMIGTIPQLDTFERIFFGRKDGKFAVSVQKDFEGITTVRQSKFKVFLGSANPQEGQGKYADLLTMYGKELAKIKGSVPLLKDSIIGFSYPTYGGNINQKIIEQEIEAGRGIFDTYIIDAGWAKTDNGFEVDTQKFPDLPGLARKMKEAGIKPGIWVSPFEIKESKPPEALKDEKGRNARNEFRIRKNYFLGGILDKMNPESLDISLPQVREYLSQQLVKLAEMGFEVFKLDFLSAAFAGQMQNKDNTSVEYYRQTMQDIREKVKEKTGKEIILIGCGGPWLESLGLFNGLRMTFDSAYPLEGAPGTTLLRATGMNQKLNTYLYRDATAVAARRAIPFSDSFGMIFDGIHIDPNTPLGGEGKENFNRSLLAYRRLGIQNMFVGDSFKNITDEVKQKWIRYVEFFKSGRLSKRSENGEYAV